MKNSSQTPTPPCHDCPRQCGAPRDGGTGFCGQDGRIRVASLCVHRGEEPAVSGRDGSITLFLPGCNLRCIFCQNWQISRREAVAASPIMTAREIARRVADLARSGGHNLNFVSPSHMPRQVAEIVAAVRDEGCHIPIIYNSNGYDAVETLRRFDGLVDVYMPDVKYGDPAAAKDLSSAPDYVEVVTAALIEMRRQVGARLVTDADGVARRGIVARHLVLPGHVDNSLLALELLADICGPGVALSLMAQYHPDAEAVGHPELGRRVRPDEYDRVVDKALELGFENGWIQDLSSPAHYRPDFERDHPFECS